MSTKSKGLGRGLDSLLPTNFDQSLLVDKEDRIQKISLNDISPNSDQPRKHFDDQALTELADSIRTYGVIQPILVAPSENDTLNTKFIIIAGERRWRASKQAGLKTIPAIVKAKKEFEQIELSLIENVQRVDLNPIEQAVSIERLHQQFNYSYKKVAARLGKGETTISNIVRLLGLPTEARTALQQKQISEGHARAILALKDYPGEQEALLSNIITKSWSVRQAEQYVNAIKDGAATSSQAKQRLSTETPQTKQLQKRLNTKVTIRRTAKGGKLELHFASEQDLNNLLNKLAEND